MKIQALNSFNAWKRLSNGIDGGLAPRLEDRYCFMVSPSRGIDYFLMCHALFHTVDRLAKLVALAQGPHY